MYVNIVNTNFDINSRIVKSTYYFLQSLSKTGAPYHCMVNLYIYIYIYIVRCKWNKNLKSLAIRYENGYYWWKYRFYYVMPVNKAQLKLWLCRVLSSLRRVVSKVIHLSSLSDLLAPIIMAAEPVGKSHTGGTKGQLNRKDMACTSHRGFYCIACDLSAGLWGQLATLNMTIWPAGN